MIMSVIYIRMTSWLIIHGNIKKTYYKKHRFLTILTKTVALTVSSGLFQIIHKISTAVFHRYLVRRKTYV